MSDDSPPPIDPERPHEGKPRIEGPEEARSPGPAPRLDAVLECPAEMQGRLLAMIRRQDPYFILVGSDPRDKPSCYPSEQVGWANRLVEAGILGRFQLAASPDACTATVYSFAGEIEGAGGEPRVTIDAAFRRQVSSFLERAPARAGGALRKVLKAVLLILVISSLALALRQALRTAGGGGGEPEFSRALKMALNIGPEDSRTVLCFFQGGERCSACDRLREICRKTLDARFQDRQAAGEVLMKVIDFREPGTGAIWSEIGAGLTTVGLARYEKGEEAEFRFLTREVWTPRDDDEELAASLDFQIRRMMVPR